MTANLLIRTLDEPKTFSVDAASLADHNYTNRGESILATPYVADGSKMRIAASIKPTADLDADTIMLWVRTFDSDGKDNWAGAFAPALTANVWTRFSADITVPSGMTVTKICITIYDNPCTFDVMNFELWDGVDATKAVASHTPYATEGHLQAVYATQAQLASLRDSVSQTAARVPGRVFVGTVVSTVDSSSSASGHEARLFTEEEFTAKFGRPFSASSDYVGVMNADGAAVNAYLDSATHYASGSIWAGVPGGADGNTIRLNYLVVLGD